jgi:hypothetical protein
VRFKIGPLLHVGPSRELLAARVLKPAERSLGARNVEHELEAGGGVGAAVAVCDSVNHRPIGNPKMKV